MPPEEHAEVKQRLDELLKLALANDSIAIERLFTVGGCHAYAFAKALRLNGTAVLGSIPGVPSLCISAKKHAWCESVIDFFGEAESVDALLTRYSNRLGWSPPFVPGTKPIDVKSFSPAEIREVLSGKRQLPEGFYSDLAWLNAVVTLASQQSDYGNKRLGSAHS